MSRAALARVLVLALLPLLAACLPTGPADSPTEGTTPGAAAITGGEIEVTPLAPAGAATAPAPEASAPPAQPQAPQAADPAATGPAATEAAEGEAAAGEAAATEGNPAEEAAPPPPPKSPEQLTCERRGGTWASAGKEGVKACVSRTRDGGKSCTSGLQCQGDCLARSGTCSPITPLFGCNEILQDNGARVTMCIE